jgi:hypothetical protein
LDRRRCDLAVRARAYVGEHGEDPPVARAIGVKLELVEDGPDDWLDGLDAQVQLVDRDGAANLIKPLGLFFPLSFLIAAAALNRLEYRWQAVTVFVAILAWPVAHIGNVAEIAVPVNVALVLALGSLALARQ